MKTVRTEEEYATAVNNEEDSIEVVGDLRNKILKIKATGSVAWGIAFAAIVVAVGMAMTGVGIPVAATSALGATAIIGTGTTTAAIAIAVAAGGTAVLTSTRDDYEIVEQNSKRLVLKRR